MRRDILSEIKKNNILGRSGSGFPAAIKWGAVKNQKADQKYVVCNGSEGEPGSLKDGYILKNYPEAVLEGVKSALLFLGKTAKAYFYLKKSYYWKYGGKIRKLSKGLPIYMFKEKGGYLAGEETCVCEAIEGRKPFPRQKPPLVCTKGLRGCPTLVSNVETFYCVGKISLGDYHAERFYTITGRAGNKGVFKLSNNLTIKQVLEETGNYPSFDFFVQAGGGASGEILLPKELDKKIEGTASIIIFDRKKTDPVKLIKKWAHFFLMENCDECVPCREGIYRIYEMAKRNKIDKKIMEDLLFAMEETSFCPLGRNAWRPFRTLMEKVIK